VSTPVLSRSRVRPVAGYAVGLLLGAAAWQLIGMHSSSQVFVTLTATLHRLGQLTSDGTLPHAMAQSFSSYAVGMVFAIGFGGLVGLLLARRAMLRTALEPYLLALYAAPMVALIPFLLALLGFGFWPKVVVVGVFAFFPVLLNTQHGAQSISPELLDVARSYRSRERDIWLHVVIPYTLPFMMTGIRQSLARGLVGMIAGDFFLSSTGLGSLLIIASERFDTAEMLATTLVITLVGVALMAIGRGIERYFARWRVSA
jgi:ABC-type nitrate/sulfonate/bicarbonate transport system permease component